MAHSDVSPGKIKGRGTKARKTRVIKRETYSKRDFKGFKSGEEIYDTITKVIEEDQIDAGKRHGIYCTVYKHLHSNARTSTVYDMTPDLDGATNLGSKELLAVLLSISRRDVDRLLRNSTMEAKVDVLVELSEGECCLTRFPVRYYTTSEDLVGWVLKDRGVPDSPLDYQLSVVKTPFKGKSKIKSMMCAVGGNTHHSLAGKATKALYPHQYPIQEIGELKADHNTTDGVPRVTNCYLYMSPREAQQLTIFHRQKNGTVDEESLTLRPSATAQEIIEDCLRSFDYLDNDPLAYRLIMKAYEFDEKPIPLEEQPLILMDSIEDCQDGYPQIWIEDQEVEEVTRTNSFLRSHSSRRASRKMTRLKEPLLTSTPVDVQTDPVSEPPEKPPPLELEETDIPRSNTEISKIQHHLSQTNQRRKTQSSKVVNEIKEQESHLKTVLVDQEKVISALNNAVSTAESISPQNSIKEVSSTKLKEALAERQTQIWELEENLKKERETSAILTKSSKSSEGRLRDLEEKYRQLRSSAKQELELEKREKKELRRELERLSTTGTAVDALYENDTAELENRIAELKLQVDKDQEIIDISTQRNAELKEEIKQLKSSIPDRKSSIADRKISSASDTNRLEVEGLQRSGMSESISITDFNEWSKDLDDLKKRNDQLLFRNKQLSTENTKLTESTNENKSSMRQFNDLKIENQHLKEANEEMTVSMRAKEAEIAGLNERITSHHDQDGSFDEYQERYYDLYEKNQRLESVMSGTIEKLRSKLSNLEEDKVQLQNTINGLNTDIDGKKRKLKEYDYMKNRVEMMEMEHAHLKEFSSQLIEENKAIDNLNQANEEKDQMISELNSNIRELNTEVVKFEELEGSLEEARGKIESRDAVVANMNSKITQKEEEISNLKGMATDFENTNELLNQELERVKKHSAALESKVTMKSEEISSFKMIIDALNQQIAESRTLCSEETCPSSIKLKEEHTKQKKEMENLLKDSKLDYNKCSELTGQLSALQSQYDVLQDELSDLEADKAEADDTVIDQEKSLKEKTAEVTELLALTGSLREEADRANEKVVVITAKRDELSTEMTTCRLAKADMESELNQITEEIRSHRRKVKQANEQAGSLQNLNEALTAQLNELQDNDCSKGKCPASVQRDVEKVTLEAQVEDLSNQRKDLQNVIIKSKNDLAEREIEYQELEASLLDVQEQSDSYRAQLRSIQRKLDPRKKKDQMDNLENQVEMYHAEVASLKSVTRAMEDDIERMSIAEQDTTDVVQELQQKNASLDKQLGDAQGEIYDLEEQLGKFKESLRTSQEESATVDMYLSERQMLKDTIEQLEMKNEEISIERDSDRSALKGLREELSIVKGVRDINTRDSASTVKDMMRLRKAREELQEEVSFLKEDLEQKSEECSRQVNIIERHKSRTRELEVELREMKQHLRNGGLVNGIDIVPDKQAKVDELNTDIADLSTTVRSLTTKNQELESSIREIYEEEQARQNKMAVLEEHFHEEVEKLHEEYKTKICTQTEEIKKWVNQNKILSEELLVLTQEKEDLEKRSARGNFAPGQIEMEDAILDMSTELNLQRNLVQKTMAQYEEAQLQIETLEADVLASNRKIVASEKAVDDYTKHLIENEQAVDEYKQRLEDLSTADENKRSEIRLLNKMVKEYSAKVEETEQDFVDLRGRYKEKTTRIEDLQKELVLLRSQNIEYENVIVALESTNATDTVDNSAKTRRIQELQGLLHEAEGLVTQRTTDLDNVTTEHTRLQEESDQMLDEIKSYQDEWRRLTSLLSNVNHTNHANMDSCKRLETKLDDIEFKVTETNVHIDICQGDMFSKTEALVRENSLLEQKIAEKSQSLKQSEKFLKESHDNINLLQSTMAQLQERIEQLQKAPQTSHSSDSGANKTELERQIRDLSTELEETRELLTDAQAERDDDDSAFKVSLDTIIRNYEDTISRLTSESEQKDGQIRSLTDRIER